MLKVRDKDENVYTMPSGTPKCILEVHYSTSYYQFVVQDYVVDESGKETYPTKNIIVPLNTDNFIDFIAVSDDELGTLV